MGIGYSRAALLASCPSSRAASFDLYPFSAQQHLCLWVLRSLPDVHLGTQPLKGFSGKVQPSPRRPHAAQPLTTLLSSQVSLLSLCASP